MPCPHVICTCVCVRVECILHEHKINKFNSRLQRVSLITYSWSVLYVGEDLSPVPVKLTKTIHKWEFVDIAELLPKYWGSVQKVRSETELTQGVLWPRGR